MADEKQNIGVEAIWNNEKFMNGFDEYIKALKDATNATQEFADGASLSTTKASQGVEQLGTGGALAFGALGAAAGAVAGAVVSALKSIIDKLKEAAEAFGELILKSIEWGSTFRQQSLNAQLVGLRMGYTTDEINGYVDALTEMGIRQDIAAKGVTTFARNQLDMTKIVELAAVAQDSATYTTKSSTEAFDDLMKGIITGRTQVLKSNEILVDANSLYREYAAEIGKTVGQLNEYDKAQALLNGVIKAGIPIQGSYEMAMENVGKQMESLTTREFPSLLAAIGQPFQKGAASFVAGLRKMVLGITDMINNNEALQGSLARIGAVFSLIGDGFNALGEAVAEGGGETVTTFSNLFNNIFDVAVKFSGEMAQFGSDIMLQFAKGAIEIAKWAIDAIARIVSFFLAFWFKPGSPPRVAPNIDKWGAGTMEAYLGGFADADFSVLNNVEGILKKALDNMASLGQVGEDDVGGMFKALSKDVAKAIKIFNDSGVFDPATFKKLEKATGKYGKQIAQLLKLELQLSEVTEDIADAEEDLNDAREDREDAQVELNSLTREYNDMLRNGATQDLLQDQLALINASKDDLDLAVDREQAAEKQIELLKEQKEVMQEMVDVQKAFLDEVLDIQTADLSGLTDAITDAITTGFGAAIPEDLFDVEDIEFPDIDKLIEEFKQNIKDELSGVFGGEDGIIATWQREVGPKWESLMGVVSDWSTMYAGFMTAGRQLSLDAQLIFSQIKQSFIDNVLLPIFRWLEISAKISPTGWVTNIDEDLSKLVSDLEGTSASAISLMSAIENFQAPIAEGLSEAQKISYAYLEYVDLVNTGALSEEAAIQGVLSKYQDLGTLGIASIEDLKAANEDPGGWVDSWNRSLGRFIGMKDSIVEAFNLLSGESDLLGIDLTGNFDAIKEAFPELKAAGITTSDELIKAFESITGTSALTDVEEDISNIETGIEDAGESVNTQSEIITKKVREMDERTGKSLENFNENIESLGDEFESESEDFIEDMQGMEEETDTSTENMGKDFGFLKNDIILSSMDIKEQFRQNGIDVTNAADKYGAELKRGEIAFRNLDLAAIGAKNGLAGSLSQMQSIVASRMSSIIFSVQQAINKLRELQALGGGGGGGGEGGTGYGYEGSNGLVENNTSNMNNTFEINVTDNIDIGMITDKVVKAIAV